MAFFMRDIDSDAFLGRGLAFSQKGLEKSSIEVPILIGCSSTGGGRVKTRSGLRISFIGGVLSDSRGESAERTHSSLRIVFEDNISEKRGRGFVV